MTTLNDVHDLLQKQFVELKAMLLELQPNGVDMNLQVSVYHHSIPDDDLVLAAKAVEWERVTPYPEDVTDKNRGHCWYRKVENLTPKSAAPSLVTITIFHDEPEV